jgi:hypothetical protein
VTARASRVGRFTILPMDMNLFWELAGWLGAALVLAAFALVSMSGTARPHHHTINLCGGALLLGASAVKDAWFSVVLNGAWIVIAAGALVTHYLRARRS